MDNKNLKLADATGAQARNRLRAPRGQTIQRREKRSLMFCAAIRRFDEKNALAARAQMHFFISNDFIP